VKLVAGIERTGFIAEICADGNTQYFTGAGTDVKKYSLCTLERFVAARQG
jgi:hypothetical protein